MKNLPHTYSVKSKGDAVGNLTASGDNLPDIAIAPPLQFGGPGDVWSPEDLLMASISNCLVLSFRAIARASKLEWHSIECESKGELDKVERKLQFTSVVSIVKLVIPETESKEKAEQLLNKAEQTCLISNSISCGSQIKCDVLYSGE